jgi:4-amino-4-deoxy-L-arabinose transferase-like glycosyltransferase
MARHGYLGTTILESKGTWMDGIEQHTYWMPPVHLLLQALWYKVFGFGLLTLRSISLLAGAAALLAWYSAFGTLAGNRGIALIATGVLAIDSHFQMYGALGRPDMLCAALGSTGIATFLHYREKSLRKALLLGHGFAAASCLTHPCGVLYAVALVILMVYFDHGRMNWRMITYIAPAYVIALGAWGAYIAQAPPQFVQQFFGNISGIATEFTTASRGSNLPHPLLALKAEFMLRYAGNFGRYESGLGRLPLIALGIYTLAVLLCFVVRPLRNNRGCRALLVIGAFDYLFMAFFDGLKGSAYLVHTLPLCAAFLAFTLWFAAAKARVRWAMWVVLPVLVLLVGVELTASARDIMDTPERWDYEAAVDFLHQHNVPANIIAGAEFAFAYGFDSGIIDDPRLGYYTGRRPEYIAANPIQRGWIQRSAELYPAIHDYQVRLLANEYRVVFHNARYTIYQRIR